MRIASIVFFILTIISGLAGTRQALAALSNQSGQDPAFLTGYVVGSYIVPAIFLALALVFWKKANRKARAQE